MNSTKHIDGKLHATGKARFVRDIPKQEGMLYVYPVLSSIAKGEIIEIDFSDAINIENFVATLTYKDIPGQNDIGVMEKGEPVFPEKMIEYYGQPVCAVICRDYYSAIVCAKRVKVKYKEEKAILNLKEAIKHNTFFKPELMIKKGNVIKGFKNSDHIIEGEVHTPIQEHFYMEPQTCRVIPDENGFTVFPASQSPTEIQEILAAVLNMPINLVTVDIKRVGGGFGGKEHSPTLFAAICAIASHKTKKSVELRLLREDDIMATGKRHFIKATYRCGFTKDGKIKALEYNISANGGAYADLSIPVLERCVLNAENCYNIENFKLKAKAYKTNLHPFTAFRGFGGPQGTFFAEYIVERIAKKLKKDPFEVRLVNLYKNGDTTPYGQKIEECYLEHVFNKIKPTYLKWKKEVENFNKKNKYKKQGIGISPIKFGISFTTKGLNRGYALVILYPDGTVSVSHGGVEMGQEVSTRVASIVSLTLGIEIEKIHIESVNTKRIANLPPTAASTAVDLNGNAALKASSILAKRLKRIAKMIFKERFSIDAATIELKNNKAIAGNYSIEIKEIINRGIWDREKMAEYQFYKTPHITGFNKETGTGKPFYYYVHGIAISLVETDMLTGGFRILKTKIIHELGRSLNREIEEGQISGAFIQGAGWLTMEEMVYSKGKPLSTSPSTYKIPTIADIPEEFDIEIFESHSKKASVFGTKGIGEPPFLYGHSVFFAIKNSIEEFTGKECNLMPPATPENILKAIEGEKE